MPHAMRNTHTLHIFRTQCMLRMAPTLIPIPSIQVLRAPHAQCTQHPMLHVMLFPLLPLLYRPPQHIVPLMLTTPSLLLPRHSLRQPHLDHHQLLHPRQTCPPLHPLHLRHPQYSTHPLNPPRRPHPLHPLHLLHSYTPLMHVLLLYTPLLHTQLPHALW